MPKAEDKDIDKIIDETMRIGIFTYHRSRNYGAVLQAYGLQEFLIQKGHEVYIIDIPDYRVKDGFKIEFLNLLKNYSSLVYIKYKLKKLFTQHIRTKRRRRFKNFVENNLRLKGTDVLKRDSFFDVFIYGSDQIWNPIITNGIAPVLVGAVPAAMGKKLIAYAASVGHNDNLSYKDIEALQKEIKRFDSVSVREPSLKRIIGGYFKGDIPVVLDPVLLAGRGVFEPLYAGIKNIELNKPYLLLFTLARDEFAIEKAKVIAKEKGLDIIEIVSSIETIKIRNIKQTESVYNFLYYIANANYVIATSYHGMILSILFEKDFNVLFENERYMERSVSILENLGIKERLVCGETENVVTTSIDYSEVNIRLDELRNESGEFLLKALS